MSRKVLIVYGTRYGATEGTSEEIAKVLRSEGLDVRVVNARKEKVKDISEYDLVIVGSGMQMAKWTGAAEKFLREFQKELSSKKVAIFVSSGAQALIEYEKKTEEIEKARKQYLEDKAVSSALEHPDVLGAGAKKRKKLKSPKKKMAAVMKEFKRGTLRSGSGEKVTNRKQAIVIGLKESGQSKKC